MKIQEPALNKKPAAERCDKQAICLNEILSTNTDPSIIFRIVDIQNLTNEMSAKESHVSTKQKRAAFLQPFDFQFSPCCAIPEPILRRCP